MTTYNSITKYVGDGVRTRWAPTFSGGFLSPDHVYVLYPGNETPIPAVWDDGSVLITPAIVAGADFALVRRTPSVTPLVDFSDGAGITELNLDTTARQAVFLAAEAQDRATDGPVSVVRVPGAEPGVVLPTVAQRLGRLAAYDESGAPVAKTAAELGIATSTQSLQDLSYLVDAVNLRIVRVATRTALSTLSVPLNRAALLDEGKRTGIFNLRSGTAPTDPQQGIYIASSTAGYYWERLWDGITGQPEWFGAVGIVGGLPLGTFDNRAALNACLALCPVMQLAALDYPITDVWQASQSSRTIQGVAGGGSTVGYGVDTDNRFGMAGGTRVVLVGSNVVTSTVFHFGPTAPASLDGPLQMRNSVCRDIVFARDCSTYRPRVSLSTDPLDCVKGVLFIGASDCLMERCWSYDSPVGFHTVGVVISKLVDCSVRRTSPALTSVRDYYVGFLHGGYGAANFGYIGNSASAYFIRCHVFDEDGAFDTSWGMRLFGRFADTFVIDFEMARLNYGIEIDGRDNAGVTMSNGAYPYAQQDVSIVNPVIDGCTLGGIWMHHCQDFFCVDILNPYIASAGFSIKADSCGGSVKVTGGRIIGTGLVFNSCDGIGVHGVHVRDAAAPLVMTTCGMFDIQLDVMQLDVSCAQAASLTGCFRGTLALQVRGVPGRVTFGVNCDAATDYVTIDGSAINPGCFVTINPANKVRYNGADARTAFGSNVLIGTTG